MRSLPASGPRNSILGTRSGTRTVVVIMHAWAGLSCAYTAGRAHAEAPLEAAEDSREASYEQVTSRALAAFEAKNFPLARSLFEDAHRLRPSARTFRALGLTALAQDDYDRARSELSAALSDGREPLTPAQNLELTNWLDWMRTTLGTVRIERSPPETRIAIDEKPLDGVLIERLLSPGEHELRAEAEGHHASTLKFTIASGQLVRLPVRLAPVSAPPPAEVARAAEPALATQAEAESVHAAPIAQPSEGGETWPWVVGGIGAAAAIGGGVLLGMALHEKATVEDAPDGVELSEISAAHDRVPWMSAAGIGLGAAGLACLTVAVVALSLDDDEQAASAQRSSVTRLRVRVGPVLGLEGAF